MVYDGVFCYSVLHLFKKKERNQILSSCYQQLKPGGSMVFVVVSTKAELFAQGKKLSNNRYKLNNGLNVFFYDSTSIEKEFEIFRLIKYYEISEPIKHIKNEPDLKCFVVECQKP